MYLDYFTLAALVDELTDSIVGGRVQDAIDVDATGVGLEIYANRQRRYLYISADNHMPRLHLLDEKLRRGLPKPTQIGLLLRRFVEGGLVAHISQPAWERIVEIEVAGPGGDLTLIVEPMERRANLLLVQNGVIIDCMRRVGPEDNRYRLSLPQHEYVPPPPQTGKLDPTALSLADLLAVFEQNSDPKRKTHQLLSSRLLAVSPLLAKEAVHGAGAPANQKASDADPRALYVALQALIEPLSRRAWQPGVAETDEGVAAFSVYPLESLPGWSPVETVSVALSAYYGAPSGPDAYKAAKKPVHDAIAEARAKMSAKLDALGRSLTDDAERETLRKSGELVLAYQYTLAPGQSELRAQYDPDEPELVIPLDAKLSPLDNAQRYFERYNKAKRALDDVPGLVAETEKELAFLAQLATDLDFAASWPEIDEVQQALQANGYWRGKQTRRIGGGQSAPLRIVTQDGFVIWLGRNSRQNDLVTFKRGGGQDLWLHARDVPGSHVVVKFDGRPIPEAVIEQAAALAAYYSANRGEGRVLVDVTQCRYVKKIKGAAPGMVTYRNETTRTVAPQSAESIEM